MKRLWIAATFVAVVVGAALLASREPDGQRAPPPAEATRPVVTVDPVPSLRRTNAESDSAGLRRDLQALSEELGVLKRQLAEREAVRKGAPMAERAEVEPHNLAVRAEQERRWHAHMAEVNAQFEGEPVELGWSATTATTLRDAFEANEGTRGTLLSVECRSQTCRLELFDDGSGSVSRSMPLIVSHLGGTLPSTQADYADQGGGRALMTLYLTRGVFSTDSVAQGEN